MARDRQVVARLLDAAGTTYADDAGITLRDKPMPLFKLLSLCMLASKPIAATTAVAAARELFRSGLRTPTAVLKAERRTMIAAFGGGLAGAKAAEALRNKDFGGQVVLFGAEDRLPYERPPLSKEFMAGKKTIEDFTVQPKSWYAEHDVDLRLGTEITTLDRTAHMVAFNDGDHEHYDKLLLAT